MKSSTVRAPEVTANRQVAAKRSAPANVRTGLDAEAIYPAAELSEQIREYCRDIWNVGPITPARS
jgi:hypothetical protein